MKSAVAVAALFAFAIGAVVIAPAAFAAEKPSKAPEQTQSVTLYVMPQCGYCEKARKLLGAHGVPWREIDIVASAEAKREFDSKGGVGTPLLVIGSETIRGFDAQRIEAALQAQGLVAR